VPRQLVAYMATFDTLFFNLKCYHYLFTKFVMLKTNKWIWIRRAWQAAPTFEFVSAFCFTGAGCWNETETKRFRRPPPEIVFQFYLSFISVSFYMCDRLLSYFPGRHIGTSFGLGLKSSRATDCNTINGKILYNAERDLSNYSVVYVLYTIN